MELLDVFEQWVQRKVVERQREASMNADAETADAHCGGAVRSRSERRQNASTGTERKHHARAFHM